MLNFTPAPAFDPETLTPEQVLRIAGRMMLAKELVDMAHMFDGQKHVLADDELITEALLTAACSHMAAGLFKNLREQRPGDYALFRKHANTVGSFHNDGFRVALIALLKESLPVLIEGMITASREKELQAANEEVKN